MVSANYMGLMLLHGLKPTENKDNNEYKRRTQAPLIKYQLVKQTTPDLGFNSGDVMKRELAEETNKVNALLLEEKELRNGLSQLEKKNAYFAAELVNPKTKGGDIGLGRNSIQMGREMREKVNENNNL